MSGVGRDAHIPPLVAIRKPLQVARRGRRALQSIDHNLGHCEERSDVAIRSPLPPTAAMNCPLGMNWL